MEQPPFLIQADQALYAPGDEATLTVYGIDGVDRVHVDLFRGVAGVQSVTVELDEGIGQRVC